MGRRVRISTQTKTLLVAFLEDPSQWRYGYKLMQETGLKDGTVYPILDRLTEAGWLESQWEESSGVGHRRKMYRPTRIAIEWGSHNKANGGGQPSTTTIETTLREQLPT